MLQLYSNLLHVSKARLGQKVEAYLICTAFSDKIDLVRNKLYFKVGNGITATINLDSIPMSAIKAKVSLAEIGSTLCGAPDVEQLRSVVCEAFVFEALRCIMISIETDLKAPKFYCKITMAMKSGQKFNSEWFATDRDDVRRLTAMFEKE